MRRRAASRRRARDDRGSARRSCCVAQRRSAGRSGTRRRAPASTGRTIARACLPSMPSRRRGQPARYGAHVRLDGIHHVTCVTGDAPKNVDYYTGTLGLRLVKKSVNQDDPTVYHLFYADEKGTPGADITFFEYPGAAPGRAGAGMIHTVVWRVGSEEAIAFWRERVGSVPFTDPEGLRHDLVVSDVPDAPLIAEHPEIPREFALQGFEGVRAYAADPDGNRAFLDSLGFVDGDTRGATRGGWIRYEPSPGNGVPGAGTVHHVAWACP